MKNYFLAFEADEPVDDPSTTDETIEEKKEPEKKEPPKEVEKPEEKPEEDPKPKDGDTSGDDNDGDDPDNGGEGDEGSDPDEVTPDVTDSGSLPENDTPPEDRPRFDNAVLSIDKVTAVSKSLRDQAELDAPKGTISEESFAFNQELRELRDQEPTMVELSDGLAIEYDQLSANAEMALESLHAINVCMESYLKMREPMPIRIGQAQNILINAMVRPLGFKVERIGMESAAVDRNRLAMEGLGDLITDMLSAVINAVKRLTKFVLSLFGWTSERDERREASARRLEERCYNLHVEATELDPPKLKEVGEIMASIYSYYDSFSPASPEKWDHIHPKLVDKKEEVIAKLRQFEPKKFPSLVLGGSPLSKEQIRSNKVFEALTDANKKLAFKMVHAAAVAASIKALVTDAGDDQKTRNYLENRTVEICKMIQDPVFTEGLSKKGSEDGFDLYEGASDVGDYIISLRVPSAHSIQPDEAADMLFGFHYTCTLNTQTRDDVLYAPYNDSLDQARHFRVASASAGKMAREKTGEKIEKVMVDLEKILEKFQKDVHNGVLNESFRQRIIQKASYWVTNKLYHGLVQAHLPQDKFVSDLLAFRIYCVEAHSLAFNIAKK